MCEKQTFWTPDGYEEDTERLARGLYRADLSSQDYDVPKEIEFIGTTTQPAKIARAVLAGKPPNLIGSKLHGTPWVGTWHAPLLDFDLPTRIKKSSTPGHHHVLVESIISEGDYFTVMKAMARAGLQQDGFARQVDAFGQTFLRWNTTKGED